jgi:hypothetical protein
MRELCSRRKTLLYYVTGSCKLTVGLYCQLSGPARVGRTGDGIMRFFTHRSSGRGGVRMLAGERDFLTSPKRPDRL